MPFPVERPRRLRRTSALRDLCRETRLAPSQLVLPLFVKPGEGDREPVPSMPGVFRLTAAGAVVEARAAVERGVGSVLLFGIAARKDGRATEARQADAAVPQAIARLKDALPDLVVMTDVCLCAYMDHGHCGVVEGDEIENDATLPLLSEMALRHAEAGADVVAPSDMMDGRVGAIRTALDGSGKESVAILSYAVKYASAFYGPFRDAAGSAPGFGDRRSYQMDPGNSREAVREARLDVCEGADAVMVKPALPYLDVIARVRDAVDVPVAAYHVSGEHAMIALAAREGLLDGERAMMEAHVAIARAGADVLITYAAREVARLLG
ncbi:MAG: porphobilinogen synthase [Acidobacteriota bacterium]